MLKYFKVLINLVNYNLIREMEFRKNFFLRIVTQVLFVILQIVIVDVFFHYTSSLGTWTRSDVFVLVGIFRLIEGAFHIFVHSNLLYLPEIINYGEFDLLLSKPISTLFLTSFRKHQLYEVGTLLTGVVILAYTHAISGLSWVYVFLLAVVGFAALFAIMLFFACLSFFIPRLTALYSIWDVISKTSRFPLDIFGQSSRVISSLVAPLLLVVTLPSQIILGKLNPFYVIVEIIGTAILLFTASKFWHFSLRHYSSASS